MSYTVEILVTAASGNVIATPRAGATGTAAVGGYAITQVDGMLHTITIAEALLGRWSLVAGDGNSQRLITFVSGVDDYYLDTGDSIKAKTDQLTFTVAGRVLASNSASDSLSVEINIEDITSRQLEWDSPSETITGTIQWTGQVSKPITGSITFRETLGDRHFYTWTYNAADRPASPTSGVLTFTDGVNTAVVPVTFTSTSTSTYSPFR